jgi:ribonucleoside-diphosphate reductase beta chain
LLTQIFRFFTQADVEVNNCYMKHYSQVFKATEVLMMLSAFSNIETVHIAAYSHLLDTVGMPELEYSAFMKYKEMKDKYDYMHGFSVDSKHEIAKTLAAFGGFTEGLQLFASFAILLNFPRFNKMKGMGQIISWSVRDESLHCISIIRLFRTFISENPEIWTDELKHELYVSCATIVDHEDAFIDLAFEFGAVEGLTAAEVKAYIRFIADRRLMQLGLNPLFHVEKNPLPWLDEMLNAVEHANFFEARSTEYSKSSTIGEWDDAWTSLEDQSHGVTASA